MRVIALFEHTRTWPIVCPSSLSIVLGGGFVWKSYNSGKILRLHQTRLPPSARSLGDEYVKAEFRTMKQVNKEAFVTKQCHFTSRSRLNDRFLEGWRSYLRTLQEQDEAIGKPLPNSRRKILSDDQKRNMLELRFLFFFVLLPLKFRRAAKIAGKEAAKPEE